MEAAIERGHLEVVMYFYSIGCEITLYHKGLAEYYGRTDILDFAQNRIFRRKIE